MSEPNKTYTMTDEECEMNLSALIDGELEPEALLPTLDHLAQSETCSTFYRNARKLQDDYGAGHYPVQEETLPDGGWEKIERKSLSGGARVIHLLTRTQVWGAAAAILLAVGLWWGGMMEFHRPTPGSQVTEVTLGEDEGSMSEQRFVELTAELLRSDRRYRRKMLEVLEEVDRATYIPEGSPEGGIGDRGGRSERAGAGDELPQAGGTRRGGSVMDPVIRLW